MSRAESSSQDPFFQQENKKDTAPICRHTQKQGVQTPRRIVHSDWEEWNVMMGFVLFWCAKRPLKLLFPYICPYCPKWELTRLSTCFSIAVNRLYVQGVQLCFLPMLTYRWKRSSKLEGEVAKYWQILGKHKNFMITQNLFLFISNSISFFCYMYIVHS